MIVIQLTSQIARVTQPRDQATGYPLACPLLPRRYLQCFWGFGEVAAAPLVSLSLLLSIIPILPSATGNVYRRQTDIFAPPFRSLGGWIRIKGIKLRRVRLETQLRFTDGRANRSLQRL